LDKFLLLFRSWHTIGTQENASDKLLTPSLAYGVFDCHADRTKGDALTVGQDRGMSGSYVSSIKVDGAANSLFGVRVEADLLNS
jgi:hypothetical protein